MYGCCLKKKPVSGKERGGRSLNRLREARPLEMKTQNTSNATVKGESRSLIDG